MSLLPFILNDPWEAFRPSRIMEQHFGLGLEPEDLLSPLNYPIINRHAARFPTSYYRPWTTTAASGDSGSYINVGKNNYEVNLDVQQFAPNEINVKVSGNNTITVEGKHEEKQDEHGFISRQFVRRYVLPQGHDVNNVTSKLSSDGVLSITVPRVDKNPEDYRTIPIQQTGVPLKTVSNNKQQEEAAACLRVSSCKKQEMEDVCQRACPVKGQDGADVCQRSCPRKE